MQSIPKTSEPFEKILELLSYDIFYEEEKPEITDELLSLDEVIFLELQWMVDSMAADYLFCRLVMDDLIFMNNHEENPSESVCNSEVLGILLCEIFL